MVRDHCPPVAVLKPISFSAFLAAAPLLFSKLNHPDPNTLSFGGFIIILLSSADLMSPL